jgi:hypothetical protein
MPIGAKIPDNATHVLQSIRAANRLLNSPLGMRVMIAYAKLFADTLQTKPPLKAEDEDESYTRLFTHLLGSSRDDPNALRPLVVLASPRQEEKAPDDASEWTTFYIQPNPDFPGAAPLAATPRNSKAAFHEDKGFQRPLVQFNRTLWFDAYMQLVNNSYALQWDGETFLRGWNDLESVAKTEFRLQVFISAYHEWFHCLTPFVAAFLMGDDSDEDGVFHWNSLKKDGDHLEISFLPKQQRDTPERASLDVNPAEAGTFPMPTKLSSVREGGEWGECLLMGWPIGWGSFKEKAKRTFLAVRPSMPLLRNSYKSSDRHGHLTYEYTQLTDRFYYPRFKQFLRSGGVKADVTIRGVRYNFLRDVQAWRLPQSQLASVHQPFAQQQPGGQQQGQQAPADAPAVGEGSLLGALSSAPALLADDASVHTPTPRSRGGSVITLAKLMAHQDVMYDADVAIEVAYPARPIQIE